MGRGYWLVDATGSVFAFSDTAGSCPARRHGAERFRVSRRRRPSATGSPERRRARRVEDARFVKRAGSA